MSPRKALPPISIKRHCANHAAAGAAPLLEA
jgi:hypothetical protein